MRILSSLASLLMGVQLGEACRQECQRISLRASSAVGLIELDLRCEHIDPPLGEQTRRVAGGTFGAKGRPNYTLARGGQQADSPVRDFTQESGGQPQHQF